MEQTVYKSPCGPILVQVVAGKLSSVMLGDSAGGQQYGTPGASLRPYIDFLNRYFAGEASEERQVPIDLSARTAFERRVLEALRSVPFGRVVSYGELAERAGCPGGARPTGGAVGRNPDPIFIPCHRVIRSDGQLGGFAAGPEWKKALLRHEGWTVTNGELGRRHVPVK